MEFERVNLERMASVLEAQGWQVALVGDMLQARKGAMAMRFQRGQGQVQVQGVASVASHLAGMKRAYAAQTVADGAKRFGWNLQGKTDKNGTIQMKLGR